MKRVFLIFSIIACSNILLFTTFCNAQTGIISTIAGTGISGFSGDGGSAVSAEINDPGKIVVDAAGNIYFSDIHNYRIRKISTSGVITTIAGTGAIGNSGDGGPATAATFNEPYGLALDDTGNLYIADFLNSRIRKINTSGIITTVAGNGVSGYTGDGVAAVSTELYYPNYVYVDHAGNIFISDNGNQRIRKVNTSGIISTVAGNGIGGYTGDGILATNAEINYPAGLWVDTIGNIYLADYSNSRIRKINTSGYISTIAGSGIAGYSGDGGAATAAAINRPLDVVMDHAGNIYIADGDNNRVRKINTSGVISLFAGNGAAGYSGDGIPAITAELNTPNALWVDNTGNVYISDTYNSRIRIVGGGNHPPFFTGGHLQTLTICEDETSVPVNTQLAVMDTDAGQTEVWSLTTPPAHGIAVIAYTTTSTGGVLTPVGLSYTPNSGFTGTDAFKVTISDGIAFNETEIDILVDSFPNAGAISGIDSICPGYKDTLSETVSGGIWSYSNIAISTISFSGVVTGMSPGYDTIIYTIVNSCGIVSAIFPLEVRSDCTAGINTISHSGISGMKVFPNPAINGVFTINVFTSVEEDVRLYITNVLGQKIKEFTTSSNNPINIKVESSPGIYFLTAVTKDNKWSDKIVVSSR